MAYTAGIDEAGRGPVIGPMVMAIVACTDEETELLAKAGVMDSKQVAPERRETLFGTVELQPHEIISLEPKEIDAAVQGKSGGDNLNKLEARTTALLIHRLAQRVPLAKVYIDSPTLVTTKHEAQVRGALDAIDKDGLTRKIRLVCECKADENYTVVGAASILAKVTRDRAVREIERAHGPVGSGYPSDPRTQAFLGAHWQEGNDFFRKSWESYQRLARQDGQATLGAFERDGNTEERKSEEHERVIKAFEALKGHGFSFAAPTSQYEVVRMRNAAGVTVISYTTGKLVVQGPDVERKNAEGIIAKLGLAQTGSVESKRPRGRPRKA